MARAFAMRVGEKYWDKEKPNVYSIGRNVIKSFRAAGKIQIFPKVPTAPNGVGRGTSLDLEHMTIKERQELIHVLTEEITNYKRS